MLRVFLLLAAANLLLAQTRLLPLAEVRPGMKGSGRTVFTAAKVEEFPVEILGVMENVAPKQSVILARLGGSQIERTGVMQGMSGSPVYIDGRLVGAVALSFPFSKEPIAGIRPIEEMLRAAPGAPRAIAALDPRDWDYGKRLPARVEYDAGPAKLVEIASPLWMSGFTRSTLDVFGPALRAAGLEPVQGMSGGRAPVTNSRPRPLLPGEMISVQLVSGDYAVGGDGTVTHVDGNNIYAFGHRFMLTGQTQVPFARAEVVALMPNLQNSFKISAAKEWLGSITDDRSTAIAGVLGRKPRLLPVSLNIRNGARTERYRFEMIEDRLLTPLLIQMTVYSSLEATEKTTGPATVNAKGRILLAGGRPPVPIENIYSADLGAPQALAAGASAPLAYLLNGEWPAIELRGIELDLTVEERRKQLQVDSVVASRRTARPGEPVEFYVVLSGEGGREVTRTIRYTVPPSEQPGMLNILVADSLTVNLLEYRSLLTSPPRTAAQMLAFLDGIRAAGSAWLRITRPHASYQAGTETLPDPPPSLALLLNRSQTPLLMSKVAEFEVNGGGAMVTGSKSITLEVKE